jgi:cyclase
MRRFGSWMVVVLAAAVGFAGLAVKTFAEEAPPPASAPQPSGTQSGPAGPADMLSTLRRFFGPVQPILKVADNLYLIRGGGGNTLVWVWSKGVLVVDPKIPASGQAIIDQIRTVTDKPVTHIVDTHAHLDHSGANAEFGATVEIIAQEKTRASMLKSSQYKGDASKPGLPTRTFKDHLRLFEGKDAVDLYYFGRAHTDGDALVVFPSAHFMHSGDVFSRKELPKIDFQGGGSGVEFPDTLSKAVENIKGVDYVVGGHSDGVMTWKDFVGHATLTRKWLEFERAQQRAGATPEATLDGFVMPEGFTDYTRGLGGFGGVNSVRGTFAELAH